LQDDSPDKAPESPAEQNTDQVAVSEPQGAPTPSSFYYVRFRRNTPPSSAICRQAGLKRGEVVLVQTEHGPEPATISGPGPEEETPGGFILNQASCNIIRRANREEIDKFENLIQREAEAFRICQSHIEKHRLEMKLTRVERYFNGSKIIFYFTAENRVDFRELVKDLVQEFRTRVEIRQIGVRHETKMLGGIGCCGRELCCSSFIKNFAPVSIKMAKEQNLPLNPTKISGVCNRLLCCLTYEYDTYHSLRKDMPKPGKTLTLNGVEYKILQTNILKGTISAVALSGTPEGVQIFSREEWEAALTPAPVVDKKPRPPKGRNRRQKGRRKDDPVSEGENREESGPERSRQGTAPKPE
jgi:cell fate regulator YaaT (PSP1 superfamily)